MPRATYAPQTRTSYYPTTPPYTPPNPPVSGASAWGYAIERATSGVSVAGRAYQAALDTTYGAVYSTYTDFGNNVRYTYNPTAWPTRVSWLNIGNIANIVGTLVHDGTNRGGNNRCVAITKRHVICGEHAAPQHDRYPYFVWPGYATGYPVISRRVGYSSPNMVAWVGANPTSSPETGGDATTYWNPHKGFRIFILEQDLPDYMVCAIPSPSSVPSLAGRPVFTVNQFNEFPIFQIYSDYDPRQASVVNADVELVTNSEFTSDISGWTDASSGWAWNSSSGGVARHSAAAAKALTQNVNLVNGWEYVIRVRVASETSSPTKSIYGVRVTVGSVSINPKTYFQWSANGLRVGEWVGTFRTYETGATQVSIWPYSDWTGDIASVSIKPLYHGELKQGVFLEKPSSSTLAQWWRHPVGGDSGSPVLTSYTNSSGQHRPVWLGGLCTSELDANVPVDSNGAAVSNDVKKVTVQNIFLPQFYDGIFSAVNYLSNANGLPTNLYQPKVVSDGYWYY